MKKIYIALITPFNEEKEVDYEGIAFLVEMYLEQGIAGFIVCGTTAESCTLSEEEKFSILAFIIKQNKSRVEIYFGCGTNHTRETLRLSKKAQNYAIDGLLLVTPYYNKPSQRGLYEHFKCIASNVSLPIILYQVESRCNCIFELTTLQALVRECPSIIGLKYASKDIAAAKEIKKALPLLQLFCGDDYYLKEMDEIGMHGIISVIAHIALPSINAFYKKGDKLYDYYFKRLSNLIFIESNPVGIKYVLHKLYNVNGTVRLPLTTLDDENKVLLDAYFDK